jgi:hypothetical protein
MCVAAQLEIILTALDIYCKESGDYSPYDYLPQSSYEQRPEKESDEDKKAPNLRVSRPV